MDRERRPTGDGRDKDSNTSPGSPNGDQQRGYRGHRPRYDDRGRNDVYSSGRYEVEGRGHERGNREDRYQRPNYGESSSQYNDRRGGRSGGYGHYSRGGHYGGSGHYSGGNSSNDGNEHKYGGSSQTYGSGGPNGSREKSSNKRQHEESQSGPSKQPRKNDRIKRNTLRSDEPRDRYEIIRTKPDTFISKLGTSGQPLDLYTNFFRLIKRPEFELVQYRVDFSPECEVLPKRKFLMWTQRDLLKGYLYDTKNSVYLTHRLPQDTIVVDTADRENNNYKLTFKFGVIVSMETRECLQVLNLILRRAMDGLKLQLVGRNLFDAAAKIDMRQYQLQLWPGYTTSIRQHEQDVLLCVEIATKVMRHETVYDLMHTIPRGPDFKTDFTDLVVGIIVLTDYNNKTYRIDDIDWDRSPTDTFETKAGPISFIEYYKQKYNIAIRNPSQPMLISMCKDRTRRARLTALAAGAEEPPEETIALIPELCRPTGLSERQRTNMQLMRAVAEHTRQEPRGRMQKLIKFNERLHRNQESSSILRQWNLQLDANLMRIPGRQLKNESIIFGKTVKELTNDKADWQNSFRHNAMNISYPLENWIILVPQKMRAHIDNFIRDLIQVSQGMSFTIRRPTIQTLESDRNEWYMRGFEKAAQLDPQLIMAFLPNNNADRYAQIKKMGCITRGIPTQIIVQKTLNNKGLKSIATKVAIQLNCKIGGTPWLVEIPTKGLMTIGIDVARDKRDKNTIWGALVATMDLKVVKGESFFSTVSQHSSGVEFSAQVAIDVTKAMQCYKQAYNVLPEKICIYRDGVGDGQIKHILESEVAQIKQRLEEIYCQAGAQLRFAFIVVSKKINTRIFTRDSNPPPGTVVDDVITLPERYDFYLVSQTVRQGTVAPTSYSILHDTLGFNADRLQALTYKMCHLYYNWSGTVRVPAVCQYAHKLTYLVAQCLHGVPLANLEKKLYFL